MRHPRLLSLAAVTLSALTLPAQAAVVYGPSGSPPALITSAPWNWAYGESGATFTPAAGGQGTALDTTAAPAGMAGFNLLASNPIAVPLNRAAGYVVKFRVAVTSETHTDRNVLGDPTDDDRAGFSISVQSSDFQGIELAFFTDRIFSQNTTFVGRGEQAAFNTTGMTDYDLAIFGSGYTLSSNGTPLLSGALRNYTGFGPPYSVLPNWIFLGDDTSSAAATFEIGRVEITAIPEPASLGLLGAGALLLVKRRRPG